MAYNRARTRTAKRRAAAVLIALLGIVILLAALVQNGKLSKMKKQCTAVETGFVMTVETKDKNDENGGVFKEYKANIGFLDASPLDGQTIVSDWSRIQYRAGQQITVYYDPNDPSSYYAKDIVHNNAVFTLVIGAAVLAIGIRSFLRA